MKAWRLVVLLILGAAAAGGVLTYRYVHFARPLGEGPAGPPVSSEPFSRVWTRRDVLLLGVGDSVTAGFGVAHSHSYLGRLVANPPDEFPDMDGICLTRVLPNLRVENLAASGSTSIDHLRILREKLPVENEQAWAIVVMTTGGNDLIHDYGRSPPREGAMYGASLEQARPWIENFDQRLNEMLDLLTQHFPGGCEIFLADIYDPTDGVGDATRAGLPRWDDGLRILAAYNKIIGHAAHQRANVHLVPMHDAFLGHGIHCTQWWSEHYRGEDPSYWYGANLEDPNQRGYDCVRRLFLIEMAKVLPAGTAGPTRSS